MVSIIGGFYEKKRYLAYVDLYGTIVENSNFTTAFAGYVAKPLI